MGSDAGSGLDTQAMATRKLTWELSQERTARIAALRSQDMTLTEIAAAEGISVSRVSQILAKASEKVISPQVETLRKVQNERIDQLLETHMPKALQGDIASSMQCKWLFEAQRKLNGLEPRGPLVELNVSNEYRRPWDSVYTTVLVPEVLEEHPELEQYPQITDELMD